MQKIVFWNIFAIISLGIIYFFYDVGFPFLIGFILSYILYPLYKKILALVKSKGLAAFFISILFIVFLILMISFIVPIINEDLYLIIKNVLPKIQVDISNIDYEKLLGNYIPEKYIENIKVEISSYLAGGIKLIVDSVLKLFSIDGVVVNLLSIIFITPFVIFFSLRDSGKLKEVLAAWVPKSQKHFFYEFIFVINSTLSKYIHNYFHTIFILCIYYGICLSFIGVKSSIMLGIFSGIMAVIPYIGCIISFCFASIMSMSATSIFTYTELFVMLAYFGGYLIEVYIMAPRLGKELGINTLWVFFAFLAGIQICGIFGLIISIPMAALINTIIRYFLKKFRESKIYNDAK